MFALTEALAAAAERLGLPAELSMSLARGTVEGAAELMRRESATSPATLRRNVTSPGGTTAAALAVLQDADGLERSHDAGDGRGSRSRGGDGGLARLAWRRAAKRLDYCENQHRGARHGDEIEK